MSQWQPSVHMVDAIQSTVVVSLQVVENSALLMPVVRVHARDADEGQNAAVTYSLSAASTRAAHTRTFGVDGVTGEVFVSGAVDRETSDLIYLIVCATDGAAVSPVHCLPSVTCLCRTQRLLCVLKKGTRSPCSNDENN